MLEIDGFRIDAELESNHSWRADVTMHPVEDGVEIADHVLLVPLELTIRGVVSATPIGSFAALRGDDPKSEALVKLQEVRDSRTPVTIRTSLDEYFDMVMKELTIPASARLGDVIQFTAVFVQIERVTNERTTIPVSLPIASGRARQGTKRGKAAGGIRFNAVTGEQFDEDPVGASLDEKDALQSTRAQTDRARSGGIELSDDFLAAAGLPE